MNRKLVIIIYSGLLLLVSCSSIGVGRKVRQVGDHSFPPISDRRVTGLMKFSLLEKDVYLYDSTKQNEQQILCQGEITTPTPGTITYKKLRKEFYYIGNIVTPTKQRFIKLRFFMDSDSLTGEKGYKWVWFERSSISDSSFSLQYNAKNLRGKYIPHYPVELATISIDGRFYLIYAVYEPLYEIIPFCKGKNNLKQPLRNMDQDRGQLLNNNQKYQIVNKEGKAIAEVYNHTYQVFDSGDPVVLDDATFCAGLVYIIVNVTHILESSTYWYK